uniref:CRC domain-containing protein n=1 Tax=Petromyzon marinus TaxID=7757 RepID=S4RAF0_PETMA
MDTEVDGLLPDEIMEVRLAAAEPTPTVATQTLGQPHSLDTAQAPAEVAISRTVATLVSTATTSAAVTTRPVSTVSFATRPVTRTTEPVITMTTPSGQPITAVALSANHKGMSEGGGQVSGMALGGGQQVLLAMLPGSDQPILLTVQPRSEAVQQMSVPQGGGTASTPSSAASNTQGGRTVAQVQSRTQMPSSSSGLQYAIKPLMHLKLPILRGSGPIITKAIYTKPISQKRVYNLAGSSLTPCLVYIGSGSAPGTPTKTFTLSHVTTEGSPGRPQLGGKIAISPLKSPSKMTVMPMSPAPVNSPQKRVVTAMPLPLAVAQQILQQQQAGSPGKRAMSQNVAKYIFPFKTLTVKTSGQQGGVKPLSMPMSTMQPISVPGSKFHYVRLVTPVSTHTTQGLPGDSTRAPPPTLQPKPVSSTPQLRPPIPIAPAQRQFTPSPTSSDARVPLCTQTPHRLIMPASSLPLRPSLPGLPPGTLLTPAAGYTMMPAQYITQLPPPRHVIHKLAPLAAAASVPSTQTRIPVNGITTTDSASRPRKPCNCTKSQCLKLYCECFANGEFCYNCNCRNCSNNLVHESDRQRAIKSCLDRNPEAFRPKIGKGKEGEAERRHNKGCHCKRSGCLKNYCECYEAKIMCSSMCKCVGCKNFEESPERKTLMHLADAAEVRVLQQTAAKTKLSSQISDLPTRPPANGTGERLPFNFVTREVAEATCDCLLTVVDEVLGAGETRAVAERRVLQEFGRCLQQIINSAGKVNDIWPYSC